MRGGWWGWGRRILAHASAYMGGKVDGINLLQKVTTIFQGRKNWPPSSTPSKSPKLSTHLEHTTPRHKKRNNPYRALYAATLATPRATLDAHHACHA